MYEKRNIAIALHVEYQHASCQSPLNKDNCAYEKL
jgi:hypothetical protein